MVGEGRKAEGEISVVGNKDWEMAFKRQWVHQVLRPDMADCLPLRRRRPAEAPQHLDPQGARRTPARRVHEGMHKYADDEIRNRPSERLFRKGMVQIGMLDEGLTEYFTRKVPASARFGLPRLDYYAQELRIALVD